MLQKLKRLKVKNKKEKPVSKNLKEEMKQEKKPMSNMKKKGC